MKKEKVIIYGAGLGGVRAVKILSNEDFCINAVTDDNSSLGQLPSTKFKIVALKECLNLSYDKIIIASSRHREKMHRTLLELGIPDDKIYTLKDTFLDNDYNVTFKDRVLYKFKPKLLRVRIEGLLNKLKKNNLIIFTAPFPLLPISGGAATRIWSLTDFFRSKGYKVGIITIEHPEDIVKEIKQRVDYLWTAYRCSKSLNSSSIIIKSTINENFFYKRRNMFFEDYVAQICKYVEPLAIIIAFAWSANVLDKISSKTLKLIDTLDVQYLRQQIAQSLGYSLQGFTPPPTREDEIRLLCKADASIAIQNEEYQELKKMLPVKSVILAEHAPIISCKPSPENSLKILFVGNYYEPNIDGINKFINTHWNEIKQTVHNAELIVCGRVCEGVNSSDESIKKMGIVPDLSSFYHECAIVINPVFYGTGLKIKATEALAFGKCLVATPEGVLGLPSQVKEAAIVVPFEQMYDSICRVLVNINLRREMEQKAVIFANNFLNKDIIYDNLLNYIQKNRNLLGR